MHAEIIKFISHFTNGGKRREVVECFTEGCCYWFAHILACRFPTSSIIVYDQTVGHFGCRIFDRVYDITGDVTEGHAWITWMSLQIMEPKVAERIRTNCIEFVKPDPLPDVKAEKPHRETAEELAAKLNATDLYFIKTRVKSGYLWAARDKDGDLNLYKLEPKRRGDVFVNTSNTFDGVKKAAGTLLHAVTWENSPVYLPDLLDKRGGAG